MSLLAGWQCQAPASRLEEARASGMAVNPPILELRGPERAKAGQPVRFDASASRDPGGRALSFQWDVDDASAADLMFSKLMGDQVEPRRAFIEENAKDVKFLDI